MPDTLPASSAGLVEPHSMHFSEPMPLECGKMLPEYDIAYDTYGELNAARSNEVVICAALPGEQHAAGATERETSPVPTRPDTIYSCYTRFCLLRSGPDKSIRSR
jgi:homoserine acetyltransferase